MRVPALTGYNNLQKWEIDKTNNSSGSGSGRRLKCLAAHHARSNSNAALQLRLARDALRKTISWTYYRPQQPWPVQAWPLGQQNSLAPGLKQVSWPGGLPEQWR